MTVETNEFTKNGADEQEATNKKVVRTPTTAPSVKYKLRENDSINSRRNKIRYNNSIIYPLFTYLR